ncbi:acyl-CoA dehydrogenase family protein [Marinactinospora thermotolerans]|uniref:acyl-CoA dehydrogenase family protein n=1 Tax=Marinactinospora thermotolerans TaxID=531310 RepID=UPI003D91EB43
MTERAQESGGADLLLPGDLFASEALLSEREREIVLRVRGFLAEEVAPVVNDHWARAEFPHHLIKRFAELDIAGLPYGLSVGADGRVREVEPASELLNGFLALELARVDASIATFFGVHQGLAMGSVALTGSPEQRRRWLPDMARMERIGAFALTEPQSGSDIAGGLATTARREGDEWVLDGRKKWIGNATFADLVVVWARDVADGQIKGFVVPGDAPGFTATTIENKIALRIVQNAEITLDGVRVPEADRLAGATGFKDTNDVLRQTRSGVAWESVGVMMGAYEAALSYATRRDQFGRKLAQFQLVQDHLVRMLGDITSSLSLMVRLAQLQDAGVNRHNHAALAKAQVTTRMREVVARARELLGGNGILVDNDVARFFADAEALYSYEGTREVNTLVVGRAITGHGAFV